MNDAEVLDVTRNCGITLERNSAAVRKMFAQFATGICVLLVENEGLVGCKGLTINSFSSVSLEPLLVAFSLKSKSNFFLNFKKASVFSINILSSEQLGLAKECSVPGGRNFSFMELEKKNFFYIPNSLVSMDCYIKQMVEAGDHIIFICEVLDMAYHEPSKNPLIFFDSQYYQHPYKE